MDTVKAQLVEFLDKCEEVKNCKFIMATTKIKDLLKAIVNSAELYQLFDTVATNFDYVAAKQKCFIEPDGAFSSGKVVLPDTVGDRLAFIFCLLVEFDRNDINFNAFLQKFYPQDGSYYASYHMFCDEVIGSLQAIICDIFARELAEEQPQQQLQGVGAQYLTGGVQNGQTVAAQSAQSAQYAPQAVSPQFVPQTPDPAISTVISAVCMLIDGEKESVAESGMSADDKEAALGILESLTGAVKEGNAQLIKSLTCGYNYLAMQAPLVSPNLGELFEALGEYLSLL